MSSVDNLYADRDSTDGPQEMTGIRARLVAVQLLGAVLGQKQALDHALDQDEGFRGLPSRDRAFCRMVVTTVLRRHGQIDDMITRAESRPGEKQLLLQNILRVGVAQIIFMDVPDHAAVDTAVNITENQGLGRKKPFVNAVLREVTRQGRTWLQEQDIVKLNMPAWLLGLWQAEYGTRTARDMAQASLTEAPLDITIKEQKDLAYWREAFQAKVIGNSSLRCPAKGPVQERHGFDDGMWWVQDAAAAIPAGLLGDVSGRRVLDLCAAPGGKTMQLAAMGAKVTALDRSANRLKRLEQNLKRVRLEASVETVVSDATQWQPTEGYDFILLDVPCSATGTIRRHPDVLSLKREQDIERLLNVQAKILDNAHKMLNPGGIAVYCTCSLQKSEGEAQVAAFLERHGDMHRLPIASDEIGGLNEPCNEVGELRILPYHQAAQGGMDGFFIARLRKYA